MNTTGTNTSRHALLLSGCMALLLSIASCDTLQEVIDGRPASVTFATKEGTTKVTGENPSGEQAIASLTATAFRPDGLIDGQQEGTATSVTVECTTGERDFIITANIDVSSAASKADMEAISMDIEDIAPERIPMTSHLHRKVEPVNPTIQTALERHVSKSYIKSVTLDMASGHLASLPFTLVSAYNTNVAADTRIDGSFTTGRYINRTGYRGEASAMTHDDISLDMTSGQKHLIPHSLYLFPNPQEEDSFDRDTWSPRHTRTVLEATLGGTSYYYPVTLPVTGANVSYEFENVLIARTGSLHPEDPLSYLSIVFSEPSVGSLNPSEDGTLAFDSKLGAIAFAPDGVDPFEIFEDVINAGSTPGVIYLGDGTLSPFNDITESLTAEGIHGLIVFKDGTIMPFDQFPSDIDLGNVARIIVFDDPELEQYLRDTLALVVESAGGLVVFRDGSLLPFDDFPSGIDLGTVSRVIFFSESALADFLASDAGMDITTATGIIVFTDGTLLPFTGSPSGIDLTGVKEVIFFDESALESFLAQNEGIHATYATGVIVMKDGTVLTFGQAADSVDLSEAGRIISLDTASICEFLLESAGLQLGTSQGIIVMKDGTVIPFDEFPSDVDLSGASSILSCNPDSLTPFLTDVRSVTISSSQGLVVIGSGALEEFSQTVTDIAFGSNPATLVFSTVADLEAFRSQTVDASLASQMQALVWTTGHSLKGWDIDGDSTLVIQ